MSWLISPVTDWWWDYEHISGIVTGIVINDSVWYSRGYHFLQLLQNALKEKLGIL